jgi:hypothetical protein
VLPPKRASIRASFQPGGRMLKTVAAMKWSGWDRIVAGSRVQSLQQTCHFCGSMLSMKAEHNCQARDVVEGGLRGAVMKKRALRRK